MNDVDKMEYGQTSQDWRHRDTLTWQLPAVLVAVGGILAAEAFTLQQNAPSWIKDTLLLFAATLAVCLTISLLQNLILQGRNARSLKQIYGQTQRFKFCRVGSWSLFALSVGVCAFLIGLFCLSLAGRI